MPASKTEIVVRQECKDILTQYNPQYCRLRGLPRLLNLNPSTLTLNLKPSSGTMLLEVRASTALRTRATTGPSPEYPWRPGSCAARRTRGTRRRAPLPHHPRLDTLNEPCKLGYVSLAQTGERLCTNTRVRVWHNCVSALRPMGRAATPTAVRRASGGHWSTFGEKSHLC